MARTVLVINELCECWGNGLSLLGTDTAAGRRLDETRPFFASLRAEMPLLLERREQLG
jgi:hypothetical protein